MLITVTARMVKPYGHDEVALPDKGRVEFRPAAHGTYEGAFRGRETVTARITDGVMEEKELVPGPWRVRVYPAVSDPWDSWLIELEPGDEPVDLVTLAPVLIVDGEKWTAGPPGPGVVGGRDNGDGTVSFELSDGSFTDPVVLPPGPAGRGISSISDPDEDSRVTITFTDGTETTVQAIRGADGQDGQDGHTPTLSWDGTALVVDGQDPVDLKGEPGEGADSGTGWRDITADFVPRSGTSGLLVLWRAVGDRCEIRFTVKADTAPGSWQITVDSSSSSSYAPWLPPQGPSGVLGVFTSTNPLAYGPARLWGRSIGLGTSSGGVVPAGATVLGELWWRRPAVDPGILPGMPTTSTL